MINFDYKRPPTVEAALQALGANRGARLLAGGTNLVDLMKRGVENPELLIDISGLPLRTIEQHGQVLSIGALVSNTTAAEHPLVLAEQPLLALALAAGATPQLRNMASVGGNMLQRTRCHYFYDTALPCNKREPGTGCGALKGFNRMHAIFGTSEQCIAVHPSDMCVALAALDTTVVVRGAGGERRLPFSELHRLPGNDPQRDTILQQGDIITGIEIGANRFGKKVHYLKIRDRQSYAFALISVAAALEIRGGAIVSSALALGGVAHKPWRLTAAEAYLGGKAPTTAVFTEAARLAMAGATGFGQNNFKLQMAPQAIITALSTAAKA